MKPMDFNTENFKKAFIFWLLSRKKLPPVLVIL